MCSVDLPLLVFDASTQLSTRRKWYFSASAINAVSLRCDKGRTGFPKICGVERKVIPAVVLDRAGLLTEGKVKSTRACTFSLSLSPVSYTHLTLPTKIGV